jgi:hypothetical protein
MFIIFHAPVRPDDRIKTKHTLFSLNAIQIHYLTLTLAARAPARTWAAAHLQLIQLPSVCSSAALNNSNHYIMTINNRNIFFIIPRVRHYTLTLQESGPWGLSA